ncbi:MAG: 6,7-dimethyl-8-ribityllumazine synthase [Gemmatimonadales bacterium]|jgi:6,7-dimethyl-8-ribityllumazine synthase
MTGGPTAKAGVGRRFCLVVSRFNQPITDRLVEGARNCLEAHGTAPADIEVIYVPGAFELPLAVRWVLDRGGVDGVAALGCVIRGETPHFEFVSLGATVGLEAIARERGIPVAFGVLTTDDGAQARARAGGAKGNKGEEAVRALLAMCELADHLRDGL